MHIWPWPLTLWPWPRVNINILSIIIICMSIINIQSLVHDILSKQVFFLQNRIFDLDIWPCHLDLRSTLTSHWYQPMYDFDQDPIIRSWFIGKKHSMRTHTHTYIPTYPPTDTSGYRVALQFYWTQLKKMALSLYQKRRRARTKKLCRPT